MDLIKKYTTKHFPVKKKKKKEVLQIFTEKNR